MRDQCFYLEFQIGVQARFLTLRRFFAALKLAKGQLTQLPVEDSSEAQIAAANDPQWLDYLDEDAIDWFAYTFDFNSEEGKTWNELWKLTTPETRTSHPMFNLPGHWDFESMIDSLFKGEYALVDLVQESETNGVLYYDPWAGPFGGSEPLVALIESFGHTVTFDSWHKGPHCRPTVGWDYDLAKTLVAAGKGFVP